MADHVGARLDPACAGAVRGRLDAGPVVRKPTVRVVDQIWAFASRQQASAFQLPDLRFEPFPRLGLRASLRFDDAPLAGGRVLPQILAETPDAFPVLEHAARSGRPLPRGHDSSLSLRECLRKPFQQPPQEHSKSTQAMATAARNVAGTAISSAFKNGAVPTVPRSGTIAITPFPKHWNQCLLTLNLNSTISPSCIT